MKNLWKNWLTKKSSNSATRMERSSTHKNSHTTHDAETQQNGSTYHNQILKLMIAPQRNLIRKLIKRNRILKFIFQNVSTSNGHQLYHTVIS